MEENAEQTIFLKIVAFVFIVFTYFYFVRWFLLVLRFLRCRNFS